MKRLLLVAALLTAAWTHAQAPEVPEAIKTLYDELCIAITTGDSDGAAGHLTQLAALQTQLLAQGDKEHPLRLAESYDIESIVPTFSECIVKENVALVSYDLKLTGTIKASGEKAEKTWPCQDQLLRINNAWLINDHTRVNPEGPKTMVKDGTFRSEERGVELAVPKGWIVSVPIGGPGAVVSLYSPDLRNSATVLAVDLPVKIAPKAIIEGENRLLTAGGLNQQILSQEDSTLAGAPSYRAISKIVTPEQTAYSDSNFRVDSAANGDLLYALVLGAEADEPMKVFKTEAEAIIASLKLTGPQVEELPAELGKIAEGKYINSTYSVSMTLAEGWKPRISKSRFLFQLSLVAPEGDSSFLLGAVDIGMDLDPKLVAQQDMNATQQSAPGGKVLGEGARDQEGVLGYQTLQELSLTPGKPQTRWSCYFMRDKVVYFVIGDAVPATEYEKVKDAWGSMVDSLTWLVDAEG